MIISLEGDVYNFKEIYTLFKGDISFEGDTSLDGEQPICY